MYFFVFLIAGMTRPKGKTVTPAEASKAYRNTLRRCQESFRWGGGGEPIIKISDPPTPMGQKFTKSPTFMGPKFPRLWLLAGLQVCKLTDFITAGIAKQLIPRMCIDRTANVYSANVGSILGQHRRRWANIITAMFRSH